MGLRKLIKFHRDEARHWRMLHANPAVELHTKAADLLDHIERRFGDAIFEGET